MKPIRQCIVATLIFGAFLSTTLSPAISQEEYTHQDLNSPAARALRQEIMNRAILRQATHNRGYRGVHSHGRLAPRALKRYGKRVHNSH